MTVGINSCSNTQMICIGIALWHKNNVTCDFRASGAFCIGHLLYKTHVYLLCWFRIPLLRRFDWCDVEFPLFFSFHQQNLSDTERW